jgi:hypothetical protein
VCPTKLTNPAGRAKMLLHEEDLKVRELSLSSAAKHPESGTLGDMLQRLVALVSHPQVQQPTLKLCQRLASIVAVRLDLVGELRPCDCF